MATSDIISRAAAAALMVALLCAPVSAQDGGNAVPKQTSDKPSFDPSRNVLDLVLAAVKRLDDILDLTVKRQDDLRMAGDDLSKLRYESSRENSNLRAEYEDRLRKAEAGRLDAIRVVDTNNVTVATERANATAQALAKKGDDSALVLSAQVTKSADDVRTLVKTTADEQSRNLQQQFSGIQTQFTSLDARLKTLEQAGAEGIGKQKFQDPALAALIVEVQKLNQSRADLAGASTGRSDIVGWIQSALMLLFAGGAFFAIRSSPARRR